MHRRIRDDVGGGAFALAGGLALFWLLWAPRPAAAQHEDHSPYAGTGSSVVKTLTQQEVDELLEGEGMGLARPAELNGLPGPRHVLDLADSLALNVAQRDRTQAIFDAMRQRARELGREIVRAETELDAAFAAGRDAAALEDAVARIADLEGRLRWVHLRAHLDMAELLSLHQRHEYDRLRGYGGHGH